MYYNMGLTCLLLLSVERSTGEEEEGVLRATPAQASFRSWRLVPPYVPRPIWMVSFCEQNRNILFKNNTDEKEF